MAYGSLATTGGGMGLAGLAFGQVWLVAGAFALVLLGVLLVRATFRRDRTPHDL